jgi:glucan 1,3-beta-glucosidase
MVGEWCLDTSSTRAEALGTGAKRDYYQRIYAAQVRAWEPLTAWTYWSYKHLVDEAKSDVWDFGKAIDLGYLPEHF